MRIKTIIRKICYVFELSLNRSSTTSRRLSTMLLTSMTLSIVYASLFGINHMSLKTVEGQPENPELKDNSNDDVNDTNSSAFSSAELFSKVKQSVVQIAYVVE